MKLTWKNNNNKSSKKRPVPTTSNLRNLPFDFDQQQNQDQPSPTTTSTNTNTKLNEDLASLDSSDSSNTKQLALSFQAQGDKLAEVSTNYSLTPPNFFYFLVFDMWYSVNWVRG